MSRIQDILSKAERDGTARRTRAVGDEYASRPADEELTARGFVESGAAPRPLPDEGRARTLPIDPRPTPTVPHMPRTMRARRTEAAAIPVADDSVAPSRTAEPPSTEPPPTTARPGGAEGTPRLIAQLDPHLVAAL